MENLGPRPFSFFPPIIGLEHNEFLFRRATWSEVLVVHCKTGEEIWIPKRFLGETSKVEDPIVIVGLTRELEFKGGAIWPYQRRVIEMPLAVGGSPMSGMTEPEPQVHAPGPPPPAPPSAESRIFRLIGGVLAVGILVYLGSVSLLRLGEVHQRVVMSVKDQNYLELTGRDGYAGVLEKLGPPASDRWQSETGAIQYRAMAYPQRKYIVVLMGSTRDNAQYIGTMDEDWKPLHSVDLPSGNGTTAPLLRGLRPF